jgi:hypothetical protein
MYGITVAFNVSSDGIPERTVETALSEAADTTDTTPKPLVSAVLAKLRAS